MTRYSVIEQYVLGKSLTAQCEDVVVATSDFAAVVDGATDESGHRYRGRSGGRFAAEALASAIAELPADVDANGFTEAMTSALRLALEDAVASEGPGGQRWPSASVVCFSANRRQVWRVGDCHAVIDDVAHLGSKRVDDAAYSHRAVVNAALVASGVPVESILADDPGARATRTLYDLQQHLANTDGPWGYGCINGRAVPQQYIEVYPLPAGPCEVILTSDGYPVVLGTLEATERHLAELVAEDPAAIAALWTFGKALRPGNVGHDDRSYLRISVG